MQTHENFWQRYKKSKVAVLGLVLVGTAFFLAVFLNWIIPVDPLRLVAKPHIPPSLPYLM